MRTILRTLLEGEGYEVFTADSAEAGIRIFPDHDIDGDPRTAAQLDCGADQHLP